jgi:hypothetical protein
MVLLMWGLGLQGRRTPNGNHQTALNVQVNMKFSCSLDAPNTWLACIATGHLQALQVASCKP